MYNNSDEHVSHLCELQASVGNDLGFYQQIKKFVKKGFKKVKHLGDRTLLFGGGMSGIYFRTT